MIQAVVAGALVVAALNALAGLLGGWRWYRCEASGTFWLLLRIGQGSALTLALAVGKMAATGRAGDSPDHGLDAPVDTVISVGLVNMPDLDPGPDPGREPAPRNSG